MSQAIMTLTDAYVNKGFGDKPQTTFKANEGSEYGVLRFKVSHKKIPRKGEKATYDNYSIEWRNVKGDAKVIELLNQPSVRVSLYGELTQEEYVTPEKKTVNFIKVTCDGRNAVAIASYGEKKEGEAAEAPAPASNDEL